MLPWGNDYRFLKKVLLQLIKQTWLDQIEFSNIDLHWDAQLYSDLTVFVSFAVFKIPMVSFKFKEPCIVRT